MEFVLIVACVGLVGVVITQQRRGAQLVARLDELPGMMASTTAAQVAEATQRAATIAGEQLASQAQAGAERVAGHERTIGAVVGQVHADLLRLQDLVADVDRRRTGNEGRLGEQLSALATATSTLGQTTEGLSALLHSPTRRGQWGERLVAELLDAAGLVEGVSYVRQRAAASGRPDVTFLLPDDRVLHLDVKFPLDNWARHVEAADPETARRHHAAFVTDVRSRVRELGGRGYHRDQASIGVVLLFAPNEQVFADALRGAPDLLDEALSAKVVLCSPSSLYAMLSIVREAMDLVSLENRSREVLDLLASVRDQWGRVCAQVDKVDRAMTTAGVALAELTGPRRRRMDAALDAVDAARDATDERHPASPVLAFADDAA